MAKKRIEEQVEEMLLPVTEGFGYELVDVEFVKEGKNWYLRAYIDKPGGVNIDDCQKVSQVLSDFLDESDPIKQSYFLEVSSPGLERPLKKERDFEKCEGCEVEVRLFNPLNGSKSFEGELIGLSDGIIGIKTSDGIMNFEKNKVALVKRIIKF